MLAVIYVALSARPVSLRRLIMLFGLALALANVALLLFHVRHTSNAALIVAATITFVAWSAPLGSLVCFVIRFRTIQQDALDRVSGFIRWTYGFAFALLPMVLVCAAASSTHDIPFTELAHLTVAAGLIGFVLERGFAVWNQRRRPARI